MSFCSNSCRKSLYALQPGPAHSLALAEFAEYTSHTATNSTLGTSRISRATSMPRPPQPIRPARTRLFAPTILSAEYALVVARATLEATVLMNSRLFIFVLLCWHFQGV